MEIIVGNQPWNRAAALAIRQTVFVTERGIDRAVEFDHKDTLATIYAVAYTDKAHPVATARYEVIDDETIRPGRVATLSTARHQGFGAQVVLALETFAQTSGKRQSIIHGELEAVPFYQRLGYQVVSDVYEDDGAAVVTLQKTLAADPRH